MSIVSFDEVDNEVPSALNGDVAQQADAIGTTGANSIITIDGLTYSNLARYVYQKAEVLAVDRALSPDLGESEEQATETVSGLITLAVPPEAVQIILNVGVERLYISLVSPDYEPRALPPLDPGDNQLPGEDPDRLTPTGPTPDHLASVSP